MLKEWIELHGIDASEIGENVFEIGGEKYALVDYEDKFFDSHMNIVAIRDVDADYWIYEFGGEYFFVKSDALDVSGIKPFRFVGNSSSYVESSALAIHGSYELLSGVGIYSEWCRAAKFLGIHTLGICEKNTLAGAISFIFECEKSGIKPIVGVTLTIHDLGDIQEIKLYPLNQVGWKNILNITNLKNTDDRWKFSISFDVIARIKEEYPDGSMVAVVSYGSSVTKESWSKLNDVFSSVYYQVSSVEYLNEGYDEECFNKMNTFLDEYGFENAILVDDAYYPGVGGHRIRKKLLAAGSLKEWASDNSHLKNYSDSVADIMSIEFKSETRWNDFIDTIILNTEELASHIHSDIITRGKFFQPEFDLSRIGETEDGLFETKEDFMWHLLEKGLMSRFPDLSDEELLPYLDRMEYEMSVIKKGGFVDYFLILWDLISWSRDNNILTGIGRGSAGGTLVAYLLYITHLDPIKYGLLFERFMNEGRISTSMPDIDVDFEGKRRDDVKKYLEDTYGRSRVCSIGTFGKLKIRAAIQKLSHNVSPKVVNYMTSLIDDADGDWFEIFASANRGKPQLKEMINQNSDMIRDVAYVMGQAATESVHACAMVVLPEDKNDIYRWIPVKTNDNGMLVSMWEGEYLEKIGLLKEDILGIAMLDKIREMVDSIKINHGVDIDIYTIPDDDKEVYKLFQMGLSEGTFHFGSEGLSTYTSELSPDDMDDLIDAISLYRPGAMDVGSHIKYIKIKEGRAEPEYYFGLRNILNKTKGLIIYQEQVMEAFRILGGFSLAEADDIRRAMGKKVVEHLMPYKQKFLENAKSLGCPSDEADKIWNNLEVFAGYGFNRCILGSERIHHDGINKSGKSTFSPTVEQMYNIRNDIDYARSLGKVDLHRRYRRDGYGTGYSLAEGRTVRNKILDIRYAGAKEVFEIELECGRRIRVTGNHKHPLLDRSEKTTDSLVVGEDSLLVREGYVDDYMPVTESLVVSIVSIGVHDVYDVEMDDPNHTFVTGEGIVTCNSHAAAYAITGYISQWFKANYPLHFWMSTINNAKTTGYVSAEMKISRYLKEIGTINKLGMLSRPIVVSPPCINRSSNVVTIDVNTNTIFWSLNKVRGVGDSTSFEIIEERNKNGQFYSFDDMFSRIPKKIIKKNVMEGMILAGCFDSFGTISKPSDRASLIKAFCKESGNSIDDYDYLGNDDTWWQYQQMYRSGIGKVEYDKLVLEHGKGMYSARIRYMPEERLQNDKSVGKQIIVAGEVVDSTVHKTKKDDSFMNIRLNINNDTFWVTVWSDTYYANTGLLSDIKGKIIIINGTLVEDNKFRKANVLHSDDRTQIRIFDWAK